MSGTCYAHFGYRPYAFYALAACLRRLERQREEGEREGGKEKGRGEEEGARWSRMNHISSDSAGFKTRSRTTKFVAKPRPRRGGMRQQRGTWKVSTHLLYRITHRTSREHTSCRFSRIFFYCSDCASFVSDLSAAPCRPVPSRAVCAVRCAFVHTHSHVHANVR